MEVTTSVWSPTGHAIASFEAPQHVTIQASESVVFATGTSLANASEPSYTLRPGLKSVKVMDWKFDTIDAVAMKGGTPQRLTRLTYVPSTYSEY